ncbi:aminotransferase class V-fold PLP-dependent enzyme [Celerinatantimonas diazotrophica]|uniref:Probable cysteine desulfurase n=1 Tax=Celerinatantimonas diazotrophica TaxID=412034 RepID=A0A4R1KGT4_9GAMM|nr:cysteine desulfurase [Celerinatantimonas diazotrophica]TCK63914.1 cysteine sulfinate desulfinase/cysteine desulfurase/selenocysteine lyase [Celerinatantimonas diazotrophica]CAG9296999.1 putative cysteine desulfurase [Celerinatantimonas diazotrophica]
MKSFNPDEFRNHFRCFSTSETLGIYLDNAATTQIPDEVLQALASYYSSGRSNVHRSSYPLANKLTQQFEQARTIVAQWLNGSARGVIWTSGTTDGLNRLADGLRGHFKSEQTILVSALEHHANLVPWQQLCVKDNLTLRIIPTTETGDIDYAAYQQLLQIHNVAVVCCCHVSNSLGVCNDVQEITRLAHQHGALAIIDGAQAVAHLDIDLQLIDCDAYLFSGHKVYAPTGIGAIVGQTHFLEQLQPCRFGGEMVKKVTYQDATFRELPYRLEPGTPNIDGVLALSAAIRFLSAHQEGKQAYEQQLLAYCESQLHQIKELTILAHPKHRCGVISFVVNHVHPFDIADWLNNQQISVRCGFHCAMPITEQWAHQGSLRISLAAYNTFYEIDQFIESLKQAIDINL